MTENEKIITYSEITPDKSRPVGTQLLDYSMQIQYTILKGSAPLSYRSPVDGFAHIIVIEGCWSGTYMLDGQPYIIRCCENAIHPVGKDGVFEWKNVSDDTVALLLFVPKSQLSELISKFGYKQQQLQHGLIFKNTQQLSLIVSRLYDLSAQSGVLHKLHIQILLLEALLCQLRLLYKEEEQQSNTKSNKNYYDKVQAVRKIIENDLSRNYTIGELAKEVGTNEQYIKKYFKQYFGKTVMNYSTSVKMEYAKKLIMIGEYRISDVARMTGYKHPTHFTTAFKKYFGFIPNSLRAILLSGVPIWIETTTDSWAYILL